MLLEPGQEPQCRCILVLLEPGQVVVEPAGLWRLLQLLPQLEQELPERLVTEVPKSVSKIRLLVEEQR